MFSPEPQSGEHLQRANIRPWPSSTVWICGCPWRAISTHGFAVDAFHASTWCARSYFTLDCSTSSCTCSQLGFCFGKKQFGPCSACCLGEAKVNGSTKLRITIRLIEEN